MIIKAIRRAYAIKAERNWQRVYWAIDLHGVCIKGNYEQGGYQWINSKALAGLRAISARNENRIILWSSCYEAEKYRIIDWFEDHGICVDFFNCNPTEANTKYADFGQKFYFSVLLDDKAGFDPETDWDEIINFYNPPVGYVPVIPASGIQVMHNGKVYTPGTDYVQTDSRTIVLTKPA